MPREYCIYNQDYDVFLHRTHDGFSWESGIGLGLYRWGEEVLHFTGCGGEDHSVTLSRLCQARLVEFINFVTVNGAVSDGLELKDYDYDHDQLQYVLLEDGVPNFGVVCSFIEDD